MPDDPFLDGLDDAQRKAVTTPAAPLAILAGAGAGKTRVLTHRIAWQSRHARIDPVYVLAVTFTRKAAGELGERLTRLGVRRVTAGTFHAIALAQLRRRREDQDLAMPKVLDRKVRLLAPLLPERGAERAVVAAEVAAEIEWAKARLITAEGYEESARAARRDPPRPFAEVAVLFERYERELRRRGLIDFDDVIRWCADILETDSEFQAAQRWRFRHLFVDEFQDANPAQFRLVRAWLGDRPDICVVGDGDQAIYGFAGADASYLTGFVDFFPGASVVRLGTNYRSSPQLVAAAGAVLGEGSAPAAVRSTRQDGPMPEVRIYPTDEAEAEGVAHGLRRAHAPERAWSSVAVLYRTNAQSALLEEALRREAVPFRVRGGGRFLDRPLVQVALDMLRRRTREHPGVPFASHLEALTEDADSAPEERREHIDAIARLGSEYVAADGGTGSLDGFLEFLRTTLRPGDDGGASAANAVELLSFHRAKGLEFDTVFVVGLEQGLVPISHAETPAELAEERRLLYVALSRAERRLNLSWARKRSMGVHTYTRSPSPWLAPVEAAIAALPAVDAGDGAGVDGGRARLDAAREHLARAQQRSRGKPPDAPTSELLDALLEWRRNMARASGVPAYVIFRNTTLEAVAAHRPRSQADLLAIPGIGPVKLARHGQALLDLVGRHPG
jgi:ATP-dependent DNA helicase UvrD/PcrA